ncbi:helix-turn-helix domain-containing protein [Metabacillus halosaccharovorans]|uniref:helix-turn-helix domain-containing protein n=1 Tax=Metabacillus halosaccharovorans TaxID=930124 RepID=UPI001C1FAC7F|nr:helix-turn-helix domain-containing protein [Metabacillus halosaccharovorans]MBU7595239.1 helix-turn-helix domain-containing protein [Metabacillus halosaccharovorans]
MEEHSKINDLGMLLKKLLNEQSLSIRKFSELTLVDKATISRIINGKRRAKPEHLQVFAKALNVPMKDLFAASGYELHGEGANTINTDTDMHTSIDSIQEILESSELYSSTYSIEKIKVKLTTYQEFSETEDGKESIQNQFEEKLTKVGSVGPFITQLQDMYKRFLHRTGTTSELMIMGGVLIYFITAVDVIPDYLFPVGFLDDAIAVKLSMNYLFARNDHMNL